MRSSAQPFLSVGKKIMLVLVSGTIRHGTKKTGIPIEWIKGAGHNSNTDRPEQINRLIEAFIDKA